ncbi:hypothetical protein BDR07DRAFT_1543642 [Suillus spraguei]|nr:hypothetical protein BDR07DRAFT_1543642 [Suillus spraguei]
MSPLYPPQQTCFSLGCTNMKKLMRAEQRPAILYTLDRGPIATYSVHLKCDACHVGFHHHYLIDYKVPAHDRKRTYYAHVLDVLHVGSHQYVDIAVVRMWRTLNLVSWTSMSNCAPFYNVSLSKDAVPPPDFPFKFGLSGDHIWSGVVQLSLIKDLQLRGQVLEIKHGGDHRDRFTAPIRARNLRIHLYGQEELHHYCTKCTVLHNNNNNNGAPDRKFSVVITDGVTVGHPCCGIHNCHEPLANNCDRFCTDHLLTHLHICAIVNCERSVTPLTRTCNDPTHQAIEKAYTQCGQARFQLQERLQRAYVAVPMNSDTSDVTIADLEADDPLEEEFEVPVVVGEGSVETLIIVPCGMILARETFYGAEGVISVVEMFKRVFHDESIKPSHIFYDKNCTLSYHVRNDPYFKSIGLSVNVFHFQCKHSIEDAWCQEHCNPAHFDELQDTSGNWLFNSSITEQTNVWFGGYHSICREMLMDRYVFFLDEIILQKNRLTKEKLHAEGRRPGNWPLIE